MFYVLGKHVELRMLIDNISKTFTKTIQLKHMHFMNTIH